MVRLHILRIEYERIVSHGKTEELEKIDPSVTSPTTYLTWIVLTANQCLCREKPATNPLSYDSLSS